MNDPNPASNSPRAQPLHPTQPAHMPLVLIIEDEEAIQPEEEAVRREQLAHLKATFDSLSERHQHVIAQRYGLDDDRFRTLSEVGEGLNLSRERVRQIEREALGRLKEGQGARHPAQTEVDPIEKVA